MYATYYRNKDMDHGRVCVLVHNLREWINMDMGIGVIRATHGDGGGAVRIIMINSSSTPVIIWTINLLVYYTCRIWANNRVLWLVVFLMTSSLSTLHSECHIRLVQKKISLAVKLSQGQRTIATQIRIRPKHISHVTKKSLWPCLWFWEVIVLSDSWVALPKWFSVRLDY